VVSGAVAAREEDCGGVVCGVWSVLWGFGVGAEGMVVCLGDIGAGGDITVVCGASDVEESNPNSETRSPNQ
jgi:hypothetical protein